MGAYDGEIGADVDKLVSVVVVHAVDVKVGNRNRAWEMDEKREGVRLVIRCSCSALALPGARAQVHPKDRRAGIFF